MKSNYYCWYDSETGGLVVAFATPAEIKDDAITGEYLAYSQEGNAVAAIANILDDTGSMCEGYLIEPGIYKSASDIPAVDAIVQGYGFNKNPNIENCGWG